MFFRVSSCAKHRKGCRVHHQDMARSTVELRVEGMTCDACARAIEKKLSNVAGVERATVDLGGGKARVEFDDSRASADQLIAAVEKIGYHADRK
jgi:copper chaperone CopZ